MRKPCIVVGLTLAILSMHSCPATAGDRELVEKVKQALKDADLYKQIANVNVRVADKADGLVLSGRVVSSDVKKKVLAVAREAAGGKKLDVQSLYWPAFDVVLKVNQASGVESREHTLAYSAALRAGYMSGPAVRFPGGDYDNVDYKAADGPPGDGIVPYRVVIDHKSTVTYGEPTSHVSKGDVIRTKAGEVGFLSKGMNPELVELLGAGHRHHYHMVAREKGSIRYTFQKWDGAKYKDVTTVSFPIATAKETDVAQGPITLGKPPPKVPPMPIELKEAQARALAGVKPPLPNLEAIGGKCTAKFADSVEALGKRIRAAKPRDDVPVAIEFQNNTLWPVSQVSFYLNDARSKPGTGYQGTVHVWPYVLPGEKRKLTAELSHPSGGWGPLAVNFFAVPRSLAVSDLRLQYAVHGIVE